MVWVLTTRLSASRSWRKHSPLPALVPILICRSPSGVPSMATSALIGTDSGCSGSVASVWSSPIRSSGSDNSHGPKATTNRSREYDGNQRRSVYFHRTASSGWDRTCWSICFNLWSRCACLSDTTDSKVKYNKIQGKQMQVHANPKCCTAEFRRGSGRSPVLSLDAINADRQVLRACSENW